MPEWVDDVLCNVCVDCRPVWGHLLASSQGGLTKQDGHHSGKVVLPGYYSGHQAGGSRGGDQHIIGKSSFLRDAPFLSSVEAKLAKMTGGCRSSALQEREA